MGSGHKEFCSSDQHGGAVADQLEHVAGDVPKAANT
jgi:hypothetical protein